MSHFPRPETETDTILEPNKRYYGRFWCVDCKRHWTSGNSWLGYGQDCTRCKKNIYPYKLSELKRPDGTDRIEKPHPQEKCERCQKLGYCCRASDGVQIGIQNRERIVQEVTLESMKELIQKRNQALEKDQKNLERYQELTQELILNRNQKRAQELIQKRNQVLENAQKNLERYQELTQELILKRNQKRAQELTLKRNQENVQESIQKRYNLRSPELAQKRNQELTQERTLLTRPNPNEPSALEAFVGLFILLILAYFIYHLFPYDSVRFLFQKFFDKICMLVATLFNRQF